MEEYAHIKQTEDGDWVTQPLSEHLIGTAKLASKFADKFDSGSWGNYLGLLHDAGKYSLEWQDYLKHETGYDESKRGTKGSHSTPGAQVALAASWRDRKNPFAGRMAAYVIAGHHAGLPDFYQSHSGGSLDQRIKGIKKQESDSTNTVMPGISSSAECSKLQETRIPQMTQQKGIASREGISLRIRMLYSCLVDADSLDTEKFMIGDEREKTLVYDSVAALSGKLDDYLNDMQKNTKSTEVNRMRNEVLQDCLKASKLEPGVFSLTVPTGGGKTLSAMAFALRHAMEYGKDRVIMAIPYTSIIEQTAKIYKHGTDDTGKIESGASLFGQENVLEHHSNFDIENLDDSHQKRHRFATENWDAPIVVTTNVQLLESLLSAKRSQCRKLHNIANSVVVLDEAQMLPFEDLTTVLATLKALVTDYDVTIVLCTATQPLLIGKLGSGTTTEEGFEESEIREIVSDPQSLASRLKRVEVDFDFNEAQPLECWEEMADQLCTHEQVLCIVDTRNDCLNLFESMPEGTWHLSASMCAEDRSDIISEIKTALRKGEVVRVISTQLIEAGVDIDFPVVYRSLTGLDSIAQAAGRCNREGKKDLGSVRVFLPPKKKLFGLQTKRTQACQSIIEGIRPEENIFSPRVMKNYFDKYLASFNSFDKAGFRDHLVKGAGGVVFAFRTFSEGFKLIDNQNQRSILIDYTSETTGKSSAELVKKALQKDSELSRSDFRKMQRFMVTVYEDAFNNLQQAGMIELLEDTDMGIQSHPDLYIPGQGICLEADQGLLLYS
ncbi:MAG: CRISPR-associated helicase Cas3' [Raoultibacter sp.]|jgi:CRISPR-associated endonuclease/helicase Cas3